jgi:hypothetical protein
VTEQVGGQGGAGRCEKRQGDDERKAHE